MPLGELSWKNLLAGWRYVFVSFPVKIIKGCFVTLKTKLRERLKPKIISWENRRQITRGNYERELGYIRMLFILIDLGCLNLTEHLNEKLLHPMRYSPLQAKAR